jgi:methyltransferase OMS1, mitochondrial
MVYPREIVLSSLIFLTTCQPIRCTAALPSAHHFSQKVHLGMRNARGIVAIMGICSWNELTTALSTQTRLHRAGHGVTRSRRLCRGFTLQNSCDFEEHSNDVDVNSSPRRRFLCRMTAPWLVLSTSLIMDPADSLALTPDQAASDYDTYAADYDALDGGSAAKLFGIPQARAELFGRARGKTLEIGVGTGLNLEYYNTAQGGAESAASTITSLTLVDISKNMLAAAQQRAESLPSLRSIPVTFQQADATSDLVSLFGDAAFDTVVDTFSLCVMGTTGALECLRQLSRVVKPESGIVLLLENSRSDNPLIGLYQDATADAAAVGGKGCVYNQNVDALLRAADLEILETRSLAAGLFRSYECRRRT